MTPETPTPRTDAQPWINQYPEYHEGATHWVSANFARQLERELATKDAQADEIYKAAVDLANMLSDKLDAERALADRLAESLRDIEGRASDTTITLHPDDDAKDCVDDCWEWSEQALAAWKEARR